jgi:hypothetical protein
LDAPGQDSCRRVGVVQGALVCGLLEEPLRIVACCLGLCEGCGEGAEGGVFDDLLDMMGRDLVQVANVPVHGLLGWSALRESGQRRGCRLVVSGLEMDQRLMRGGDLLVVLVELVPAGGGDDDEDRRVEEHRQGSAVSIGNGLSKHRAYGAAQGSGVVVFGVDAGAGGALERGCRFSELVAHGLGCGEVTLGGLVVGLVEVMGDAFGCGGGLVPGVGPARARLAGGLRRPYARQAFLDLGEGQVRGEFGAGVPDGTLGVVRDGDLVSAYVA